MFRQAFSCFVLAGLAVFVAGCQSKSTSARADAAPEAAVIDGRVLTGDTVANIDSGIPSTADVAASGDGSVPFTTDVPAQDGRQRDAPAIDAPAIQDSRMSPLADASRDTQDSGEWLDDAGVCRSNEIPRLTGQCGKTFQAALTSGASGYLKTALTGWCQDILVWISYGPPSVGCAYDSTGSTLVAQHLSDDTRSFCNRTSYEVSTPSWPWSCHLTPIDAGSDAR